MIDRPRCGTMMSPSPDLCMRLRIMWHRRPWSASSTPGDGRIGTSTPAKAAIRPLHGPQALTTTSARNSPSLPVTRSRTTAPLTSPFVRSRPVTCMNGASVAPLCAAVAKKRSGMRIGSTVASGTRTAAFSSGLRLGSRRSACAGVSRCARMPHASQPSTSGSRYSRSSSSTATNSPSFSSKLPGQMRRSVVFSTMHSIADSRSDDGVARAAVQQAVMTARRPGGEIAALDERHAQAAQRQVVRERASRSAPADDQDMGVVSSHDATVPHTRARVIRTRCSLGCVETPDGRSRKAPDARAATAGHDRCAMTASTTVDERRIRKDASAVGGHPQPPRLRAGPRELLLVGRPRDRCRRDRRRRARPRGRRDHTGVAAARRPRPRLDGPQPHGRAQRPARGRHPRARLPAHADRRGLRHLPAR